MKKRLLSVLLVIVMLTSMLPTYANAAGTPEVYVDTTMIGEVKAGDSVAIPVSIKNNPGIMGAYLEFDIPDVLTYVSVEEKAGADSIVWTAPNKIQWDYDTDYNDLYTDDGVLFVLNFVVNAGVDAGEYGLEVGLLEGTAENLHNGSDAVAATFKGGTIKIVYDVAGLSFVNGSQEPMSFDEAKAEALGTGSLTKPDSTNTYYFAGWFTGLSNTYKDGNGFYVIDTTETVSGIAGTELRPRYDTPPTEGTYNALWVKGDGTGKYMMVMGANSFDVYYNTDNTNSDDGLLAVIKAADGARIKLLHDISWGYSKSISATTNLDLNGCTVTQTQYFNAFGADSSVESSRAGGTVSHTKTQGNFSSSMGTVRDITLKCKGTSSFTNVTLKNCVIENNGSGNALLLKGDSTIDGCTITGGGYLVKAGTLTTTITITNSTLETSNTAGVFSGYNDPDIPVGGTIVFGEDVKVTATKATTLTNKFKEVRFNTINGEYKIAASAAVPFTLAETITIPDGKGCGLVDGVLTFGSTYTVTYKTFDGQSEMGTLSVLEGTAADLVSKSSNYADAKYKHGGWSLTPGGEALTSYIVTGDVTLYAVRAEAGPRDEIGNELSGDVDWGLGTDKTTATITNANKLGDLNSLHIDNQISNTFNGGYNNLYFSAAALDSIASLVTGNEVDITLNRIEGTETDGFVTKLELDVTENGTKVNFNGPVRVRFRFNGTSAKTYRVYHVDGEKATGIATSVSHGGGYSEVEFTTNHFSTFELREVELANGYTAGLSVTETEVRAGGNTVNVTVDVTHQDTSATANDTQFNAAEIVVAYDPALLTPVTTGLTAGTYKVDATTGKLTIEVYGDAQDLGAGVFNLQFTTCASVDADTPATVTLERAAFADSVDARTEDLIPATIDPASDTVTIQLEELPVTKNENNVTGDSTVVKGNDYTFTVVQPDDYNYSALKVTVGGTDITDKLVKGENGQYTIPGEFVIGAIVIEDNRTPNVYDVTTNFTGDDFDAATTGSATYGVDFQFNIPTLDGYQYTLTSVMINGTAYTGYTAAGNVVTIPGADIKGEIVITIDKDDTLFNVTIEGNGAGDAAVTEDDGDGSYDKGDTVTLTVTPAPGYTNYVVTATMAGVDVTNELVTSVENQYTLNNIDGDIVFTVTKEVSGTVEVLPYLTLNADDSGNSSLGMFLVLYTDDAQKDDEGNAYYTPMCNGAAMYWSAEYEAFCYLVIATDLAAAEENVAITAAATTAATNETIEYTMNVNGSSNTAGDAADAQLVYDMYMTEYQNFDTVNMMKFLLADTNHDKKVDTLDAEAIINSILGLAADTQ